MDLKTRLEVLPCGKCEDMIGCDSCLFQKEAKDLYQQIRAEVIDNIKDSIHEIYHCQYYCMADMCEHDSPTVDMCIDCFYETIENILEQLKEKK